MGEARRRKLAGEPPKGPKRDNFTRKKERDLMDDLLGPNPMVTAMALMMGARLNGRSSMLSAMRATENENKLQMG